MDRLREAARELGAGALITTAKDWARLGERWHGDVPLWVLEVAAQVHEPEGSWMSWTGLEYLRPRRRQPQPIGTFGPLPSSPLYRMRRKYFTIP